MFASRKLVVTGGFITFVGTWLIWLELDEAPRHHPAIAELVPGLPALLVGLFLMSFAGLVVHAQWRALSARRLAREVARAILADTISQVAGAAHSRFHVHTASPDLKSHNLIVSSHPTETRLGQAIGGALLCLGLVVGGFFLARSGDRKEKTPGAIGDKRKRYQASQTDDMPRQSGPT